MRRPVRPQYKSRRARPGRPSGRSTRITPLHWIIGAGVLLIVILVIALAVWLGKRTPEETATPTIDGLATEIIQATATPVPVTETPLPSPTPTPIPCVTLRDTLAYSEPEQVTITEPLDEGRTVYVIREVFEDGVLWYEANVSGLVRYIPAEDVSCPVAP